MKKFLRSSTSFIILVLILIRNYPSNAHFNDAMKLSLDCATFSDSSNMRLEESKIKVSSEDLKASSDLSQDSLNSNLNYISSAALNYDVPQNPHKKPARIKNPQQSLAARKDVDYGSFMQDLQRRIQQAWKPANADKGDKVIISFVLKKDGSLVQDSLKTLESSNSEFEAAAKKAILEASLGFRPLPKGASDQVRIDYTFTRMGSGFSNGVKKK